MADQPEFEELRAAWPDAEPPARLDRAVRRQACMILAQERAARERQALDAYPEWLLVLVAGLLLLEVVLLRVLPAGQVLERAARQALGSPLGKAWLCLLGSNLLAALLAPMVVIWRNAHGN